MHKVVIPLVGAVLTSTLSAQAPVVTPAGDPSVQDDSIYALAVDPADYPEESFVYLLDDGILRLDADGRGTRTFRQVIQILTKEAANRWSEHVFGYVDGRDRFTLNWIRVVKPDGTVISDGPAQRQESHDIPETEYPVYTDARTIRVTLGGVEPGTIVDFSTTSEKIEPVLEGDFTAGWSVTTGVPVMRSRYVVDIPEALDLRIEEDNLDFERSEVRKTGRVTYTWVAQDVPGYEPEPFAAFPNDVVAQIGIGSPIGWDSIASWYNGLARDRYQIDDVIRQQAALELEGAETVEDTLRALHRWVAQDFRYVSLSLGIGGYQPRPPDEVFQTRFGDCKDKATLFIALARSLGIPAFPVIVSLRGEPDSTMPTISQFDHMIAAVTHQGKNVYLDLTADLIPYGSVPGYLQGEMGLLVHDNGDGEVVVFPASPPEQNLMEVTIRGELSEDGTFQGWYEQVTGGTRESRLRGAMSQPSTMTKQDSTRWLRSMASAVFRGATVDSAELFDGRDLEATPRLALRVLAANATTLAGDNHILTLPMPVFGFSDLIAELESAGARRFPIDASALIGPIMSTWRVEVTLPNKWKAVLPATVSATSPFGTYRSSYVQRGRVLTVTRRIMGRSAIQPPERIGELIDWLKALGEDNVRFLAIEAG